MKDSVLVNSTALGLIGDIGATNARFALVRADGDIGAVRLYALNDYPTLADAIDSYLAEAHESAQRPVAALRQVRSKLPTPTRERSP